MSFPIISRVVFDGGMGPRCGPCVSVVVTVFNYQGFVEKALDSIHKQCHDNLDLVVVNDQSTDHSEIMVRSWLEAHQARFWRCRLLTNAANYGLAVSRNVAFEHAVGEFVFVLDADNEVYPTAIARLLRACLNSGRSAAYSQTELFGDRADIGPAYFWDPAQLAQGNYIDAMALIRKSAWSEVGGYDMFETAGWEDFAFWCKFVERKFEAIFVPQILCRYRVHGASMLAVETNPNTARLISEMLIKHPWLELS